MLRCLMSGRTNGSAFLMASRVGTYSKLVSTLMCRCVLSTKNAAKASSISLDTDDDRTVAHALLPIVHIRFCRNPAKALRKLSSDNREVGIRTLVIARPNHGDCRCREFQKPTRSRKSSPTKMLNGDLPIALSTSRRLRCVRPESCDIVMMLVPDIRSSNASSSSSSRSAFALYAAFDHSVFVTAVPSRGRIVLTVPLLIVERLAKPKLSERNPSPL